MTTAQDRPQVLYLTHHLPWPVSSGGRLREAELLRRMSRSFDIELVAISKTPDIDRAYLSTAAEHGIRAHVFPALSHGSPGLSPHVRRHHSPGARRYLTSRLTRTDDLVIHVEGHYLLGLLPPSVRNRALIVEHNVESTLFEQQATLAADDGERRGLLLDAKLTRQTERAAWRTARMVAAVTEDDALLIRKELGCHVPVIPGGADHLLPASEVRVSRPLNAGRIAFVANLAYAPNLDAARFLVQEVFPAILARCPEATLAIVGANPPQWLIDVTRDEPNIVVTGWVPDVTAYLDAADVVLCPLRIGGGVKIKVLEAVARGRAIVTTAIGMQGLRHLPRGAVVECEHAASLVDACVRLLCSPQERERQQASAAGAAQLLPTWTESAEILGSTWSTLAAKALTTALVRP
jgi:glycosyltransferase involved in cell wall biosynthesis